MHKTYAQLLVDIPTSGAAEQLMPLHNFTCAHLDTICSLSSRNSLNQACQVWPSGFFQQYCIFYLKCLLF
jgi:hypothetical protein